VTFIFISQFLDLVNTAFRRFMDFNPDGNCLYKGQEQILNLQNRHSDKKRPILRPLTQQCFAWGTQVQVANIVILTVTYMKILVNIGC